MSKGPYGINDLAKVIIETTGQNVGPGSKVFKQKQGTNLQFKTLVAGANVNLLEGEDTITVSSSGGNSGVTIHNDLTDRTASDAHPISSITGLSDSLASKVDNGSSLGSGTPVFSSKFGSTLRFRSLVAGPGIYLEGDFNTVTISSSSPSVASIAALRTTPTNSTNRVNVTSYYAGGITGGGVFQWNSTSTAPDNGGTVIQVTGVTTGRWIRVTQSFPDLYAFGARCDGATNDTTPVRESAKLGCILIPNNVEVLVTGTVTFDNGTGGSVIGYGDNSRIKWQPPTTVGVPTIPLFQFVRTSGSRKLELSNFKVTTTVARAGYIAYVEESRASGQHVVGAFDTCIIDGVRCERFGSGYFTGLIHTKNAGGNLISNTSFVNEVATAQSDVTTSAIYIENTANYFMIRTLHMDNFYLQRTYRMIKVEVGQSVESIYMDNGELVGCTVGLYKEGVGALGTVAVNAGVHFDCLESCIDGVTSINILRVHGADLRLGANGGNAVPGACIRLGRAGADGGNYLSIKGCHFSGGSKTGRLAVDLRANTPASVIEGNTFRSVETAVLGPFTTNLKAHGNTFQNVDVEYNVNTNAGTLNFIGGTDVVAMPRYSGDVRLIDIKVAGSAEFRLSTGATGLPSGVSANGSTLTHKQWDINSCHQILYPIDGSPARPFYQRKVGGSWSGWVQL